MKNICVSVILTCYNKEKFLDRTIKSILSQKCNFNWELILIDDCSTDNSYNILQKIKDQYPERIVLLKNKKNIGIAFTWRRACDHAKGTYIARIDGDDYWSDEEKLKKQVDLLKSSKNFGWCTTDFDITDFDGNIIYKNSLGNNIIPFVDDYESLLAYKGMTMASTWVCETDLMLKANKEADPYLTDDTFPIQLELFRLTKRLYLDQSTTVYCVNKESDSQTTKNRELGLFNVQKTYLHKYPDADFKKIAFLALKNQCDKDQVCSEMGQINYNMEQELEICKKDIDNYRLIIDSYKNSKSWKITKPLRFFSSKLGKKKSIY